ncbi:MAG: hypothetical protein FWG30_08110 [Eubacteriaceae bacterium]|jgi:ABC-type glycerol-3-phosphate transport system substrate-binding protein|nr:hypothetical protein [Eubacteriaceae bacterium]
MKKFVSLLLVLAMLLTFAACGGNDDKNTQAEGDDSVTEEINMEDMTDDEDAPPDITVEDEQALEQENPEDEEE